MNEIKITSKVEGVDDAMEKARKLVEMTEAAKQAAGELAKACKGIKVTVELDDGIKFDLSRVPTFMLVHELSNREGVNRRDVEPYERFKVKGEGPAIVLIVED